MKKIPVILFLQSFGLTPKKIFHSIENSEILTRKKNKFYNKLTRKALTKLSDAINEQNKNKDLICFKI